MDDMGIQMSLLGTLTIAGRPEHLHKARALVARTLGADSETAILLVSELVTNSVRHSNSQLSGGRITIRLLAVAGGARVEVTDAGGPTIPTLASVPPDLAEGGRGLWLVESLADRWGFEADDTRLVTWFELAGGPP
jgi:serine/threonine-protein kinase RsbW